MADEDTEKAEKLAAARKKFELLKKQKAKKEKAQKGKKDKAETADLAGEDAAAEKEEASVEDGPVETDQPKAEEPLDETVSVGQTSEDPLVSAAATTTTEEPATTEDKPSKPALDRQLTESQQSRLRSESFKSGGEEVYKKQAARIEQLEKENTQLVKEAEAKVEQIRQAEAQIEELREGQSEVAELRTKASKVDGSNSEVERLVSSEEKVAHKLEDAHADRNAQKSEIQSLERQNAQLQSADKRRRASSVAIPTTTSHDEQLAAKTSTIESLELELSNLRHSLTTLETSNLRLTAQVTELETSNHTSSSALAAAQSELTTLRSAASASTPSDSASSTTTSKPDDDATRLKLLTTDLAAAQRLATDASARSETLQKKIDTLTSLHRDAETARNKELDKLRFETAALRVKAKAAIDAPGASTDGEDDEDDAEGENTNTKAGMRSKIRALEAEVFDLKRGVWREKRVEMQEGGNDDAMASLNAFDPAYGYSGAGGYNPPVQSPGARSIYDDVDLATPAQTGGYSQSPSLNRMKSSGLSAFSVNNVLSAFTGATSPPTSTQGIPQRGAGAAHLRRKSSLGGGFFAAAADLVGSVTGGAQGQGQDDNALLEGEEDEDEFVFDEDAFRRAREEEDRKRLERVREVKRGLVDWRGWRVDMVEVCGGGATASGVFDI